MHTSIDASNNLFNPKNNTDHNKFNPNCIANIFIAFAPTLFFTAKYNDIPIMIYNIVHTGPNIQPGGLNEGLCNPEYHLPGPALVNNPPMTPINRHNNTNPKILRASGICFLE